MSARLLLALPVLLAALAAQDQAPGRPTPRAPEPAPKAVQRTVRGSCSEPQSRDLFRACDADSDDRLDVFEASDALDTLQGARDTRGFSRLDRDRDGYVSWPEFDRALRETLDRGASFVVRTARPYAPPSPAPESASPAQQFLQLHDANQNGGLEPAEIDSYIQRDKLAPELGVQLKQFDSDRSGRVDVAELTRGFAQLGIGVAAPPTAGALPEPWQRADLDRSGTIDVAELAAVLRRLDPTLARWAEALLLARDRNGDGVLQAEELTGASPASGRSTAALSPGQLPGRPAVR